MILRPNSDVSAEITVVAPEFSLLWGKADLLEAKTEEAFLYSDRKERKIIFEMRRLLHFVTAGGLLQNDVDLLSLSKLMDHIHSPEISESIRVLFPGNVDRTDISDDTIEKMMPFADSITVSLTDSLSSKVIQYMLQNNSVVNTALNILTDQRIPSETVRLLSELWNGGTNLTLCRKESIAKMLASADFGNSGVLDVFEGMITVPGKTVVKRIPADITDDTEYYAVKEMLRQKITDEVSRRFIRSTKGNLYYRQCRTDEQLYSLGILYDGCISANERKVKGILCGGADHDVINFQIKRSNNDSRLTAQSAKRISAVCRYLDGIYPIKPVPSFRDIRYAKNTANLKDIIKQHTDISVYMNGGSLLELHVGDTDLLSDNTMLASFISDFFGYGGMMLKLIGGDV